MLPPPQPGAADEATLKAAALDTLQRVWGHSSFREPQADIVASVLQGRDTLGLMPTGGGKSVTFQVPALMQPGLALVVTPLIALMKDQVDNLRARGVKAAALHSALTPRERRLALDRCRFGGAKLLYVSPERLQARGFIDEVRHLPVSLIVVDEAHCISQWGYDFRPSYLEIARLRPLFPQAPVLALTASATPAVADDIRRHLDFRPGHTTWRRSFARNNISWLVRHTADKEAMLMRILAATRGSAIVYARSRKRVQQLAAMLNGAGIPALYYHAGVQPELKDERQTAWKEGRAQVMVATNAFGMGIDKPDVRTVVHWDLPPSLEEYYQEAGRAGRDGLPAWAVLLAGPADRALMGKRLAEAFPEKEFIRRVYELALNFVGVALGEGQDSSWQFDLERFCFTFDLPERPVRSALRLLTAAGWVEFVDDTDATARLMITCTKRELYDLELSPDADAVLQGVLRSVTGLFADYVPIDEPTLGMRLGMDRERVYNALLEISRTGAAHYVPRRLHPLLWLPTRREEPRFVTLPRAVYEDQRERMKARLDAMKAYAWPADKQACRADLLLGYFGEPPRPGGCGMCDPCRERRAASPRARQAQAETDAQAEQLILELAAGPNGCTLERAQRITANPRTPSIIAALADSGRLRIDGLSFRLP